MTPVADMHPDLEQELTAWWHDLATVEIDRTVPKEKK